MYKGLGKRMVPLSFLYNEKSANYLLGDLQLQTVYGPAGIQSRNAAAGHFSSLLSRCIKQRGMVRSELTAIR